VFQDIILRTVIASKRVQVIVCSALYLELFTKKYDQVNVVEVAWSKHGTD
jgi:hypothetical protein